jgi:pilus assembly protein CpaF
MVMMSGFEMPIPVIRQYIASAITLVVHLSRLKGGARKIIRISEIVAYRKRRYIVKDIFGFNQTGVRDGRAVGEFYASGYAPKCLARLQAAGIEVPVSLFEKRIIPHAPETRKVLAAPRTNGPHSAAGAVKK